MAFVCEEVNVNVENWLKYGLPNVEAAPTLRGDA